MDVLKTKFGLLAKVGLLLVVLIAALGAGSVFAEAEVEEDQFALIVDFVVSRDPVLASQRTVMEAAERLDTIKVDSGEGVPTYAQSQLLQNKLESVIGIREAQETYSTLKRELISEVFANIARISALRNQIENNKELLELLQERLAPTERQVEAGLVDADGLWALSERIINVQIAIADAEAELVAVGRETAFNYGGEDWQELLALLQNLK